MAWHDMQTQQSWYVIGAYNMSQQDYCKLPGLHRNQEPGTKISTYYPTYTRNLVCPCHLLVIQYDAKHKRRSSQTAPQTCLVHDPVQSPVHHFQCGFHITDMHRAPQTLLSRPAGSKYTASILQAYCKHTASILQAYCTLPQAHSQYQH